MQLYSNKGVQKNKQTKTIWGTVKLEWLFSFSGLGHDSLGFIVLQIFFGQPGNRYDVIFADKIAPEAADRLSANGTLSSRGKE